MTQKSTKEVNWMQTFSGKHVVPLSMQMVEVNLKDIAHSLALQCRFRGHCKTFYSVAEHSVRVANTTLRLIAEEKARKFASTDDGLAITPADYKTTLLALMHDAHEAYTGDELRGFKTRESRENEDKIQAIIVAAFKLNGAYSPLIKQADNMLLATEARDLMTNTDGWYLPEPPLTEIILPIRWEEAERIFIAKYDNLVRIATSEK